MAATPAYEFDLPPGPFEDFINGEKVISVATPLESAPTDELFYLSRRLYLPPGKCNLQIVAADAVTVMIGTELTTMRKITSAVFASGVVTADFFVLPGETRIDMLIYSAVGGSTAAAVAFTIYRDNKLFYTSSATDWLFDSEPIPDDELLGDTVEVATLPVWTLLPNWANGITERLTWLTDVLNDETGTEQRRTVREFPRRSFEASFLRTREQRARLDNFMVGVGRKPFLVPLWHEQFRVMVDFSLDDTVTVTDPVEREFRPGTLVLMCGRDPNVYEVIEIESLDTGTGILTFATTLTLEWKAGTRMIPLRKARVLDSAELNSPTDAVSTIQVRFELSDPDDQFADPADYPDTTALSPPSWGDDALAIFWFRPNFASAVTFTYERDDFMLDSQVGPIQIVDPSDQARIVQRFAIMLKGREQTFAFRRFLAMARGRAVPFFTPTYMNDLIPVTTTISGTSIQCKLAGFASFMATYSQARTTIAIVFRDGTSTIYRTVTTIEIVTDEESVAVAEQFNLAGDALAEIEVSNIKRIQWLVASRFDQDGFELLHHVDECAAITTNVVTRSIEDMGILE